MKAVRIKVAQDDRLEAWAIEREGHTLYLCPCCGLRFRTSAAAHAVMGEIVHGRGWSWSDALTAQRAWIEGESESLPAGGLSGRGATP
jgi:hypothetical protein